jgi:hypothetical protein
MEEHKHDDRNRLETLWKGTSRNLLKFGATQRIDWGFALLPS